MTAEDQPERLERIRHAVLVNWIAGPPAWHKPILKGCAYLTLTRAARRCDVDRGRLERMLAAGEFPNARKTWDGGGPWMIPVIDLIAHDLIPDLLALPAEAYPAR